jgi:hypothetical protein
MNIKEIKIMIFIYERVFYISKRTLDIYHYRFKFIFIFIIMYNYILYK